MKRAILFSTIVGLNIAIAFGQAQVGQPAPDFTAEDIHGNTHQLSDYEGKIVVLEAYNLDCPYSANHYNTGAMPELQKQLTEQGVVWLVVNSTAKSQSSYRPPEKARAEAQKVGMKATAWLDDHSGEIGKKYGMKTTPHMFVIDKEGTLAYEGAIDDRASSSGDPRKARNYVREAVDQLMAGKDVARSRTRPYGCGIKYAK